MEQAYTIIGRAVASAQRFETLVLPIFHMHKAVTDDAYFDQVEHLDELPARARKQRISDWVKALKAKGQIAPDLEERITNFLEDRNLLIHRWMGEHGWPKKDDVAGFAPIIELAYRVYTEGNYLTKTLVTYFLKHDDASIPEEHLDRIANLFHLAHLEEPE